MKVEVFTITCFRIARFTELRGKVGGTGGGGDPG